MNFDKQKLLAYALGELDPKEAHQLEAFLKTNAEAAKFVRENQQLAKSITAELSNEKIPTGKGIGGLEQSLLKKRETKPNLKHGSSGWLEGSAVVLVLLAAGIYWRTPLMSKWQHQTQQTDASLDFYQTNLSSLSGKAEIEGDLSALEVKNALAEWKERPKIEESVDDCHFSLPTPSRIEAGLTKSAAHQKAWFFLLNNGKTQLRLMMNTPDCQLSLDVHTKLATEAQAEVDEELRTLESELGGLVESKK